MYPKYDYDPTVTKEAITGEAHTIPSSAPYEIFLKHIPRKEDPSTVVIPGFTEVTTDPLAGEFKVNYYDTGLGKIEFNSADAGKAITVDYNACGTVMWAETYADGREGINAIQDKFDAINGHTHTGAAGDGPKLTHDAIDTAAVSAFRAYNNAVQSVAALTVTTVAFQVEGYDNLGEYDATTYTFTVSESGLYNIGAIVTLDGATLVSGGRYNIELWRNDSLDIRLDMKHAAGSEPLTLSGAIVSKLNAGDTLKITTYTTDAADIRANAGDAAFFASRIA